MKIEISTLKKYIKEGNAIESIDYELFSEYLNSENLEIEITPSEISQKLLKFIILNDSKLIYEDKAKLMLQISENDTTTSSTDFWKTKIKGLDTIVNIYEANLKNMNYNFDLKIDDKYIPIHVSITLKNATKYIPRHLIIEYNMKVLNDIYKNYFQIFSEHILNLKSSFGHLDIQTLFSIFDLFPQKSSIKTFEESVQKSQTIYLNSKLLYFISKSSAYINFENQKTELYNDKVIIEDKLEYKKNNYSEFLPKYKTSLPYVRVFSLNKKKYYFVHIDDLIVYEFDNNATNKLILSDVNQNIIEKIFTKTYTNADDVVKYKGNGIIILAVGETGTGKTSTAEVYSEQNHKFLYILQADELGVYGHKIEEKLTIILNRIQKWNTVLLIDEADIFLSQRGGDLEKSIIVGIFLRLLEYFEGIIFLTSNRLEVIDRAILSRVTLVLNYPKLSKETRAQIWKINLENFNINVTTLDQLSALELSGRDIRNYTKLISIAYDGVTKEDDLVNLIKQYPKDLGFKS